MGVKSNEMYERVNDFNDALNEAEGELNQMTKE